MANDVDIVIGAQDKATAIIDKVAGQVGGLGRAAYTLGPAMVVGGVAVGAMTAAVVALGAVVVPAANRIDDLSDIAAGLGESVGDLQAFQFAMNEAGNVDASKSIDALQKIQRIVGEVATGGNEAAESVFKKLNLDAQELSLQGPVAQFAAVREAIGAVENSSERAALAQKLLGKSAADLIPALMQQTDAFKESEEYARRVGAVVSDEGAASVASMNDAIGRVGAGLEGMANTLAIAVAPAVETIANVLAEWLPPIVDLAQNWLPYIVDMMAYVADGAIDAAKALNLMDAAEQSFAQRIAESRRQAAERSAELREQREAIAAIGPEQDTSALEAAQKDFETTIAALQRQLAITQTSEDFIKAEEQLAAARNAAEREAIALLQKQIALQEESNRLDAEKDKEAERLKKEDERKAEQLQRLPASVTAVESRILTRGPAQSIASQQLAIAKQHKDAQDKANEKLELIYQESKRRGKSFELQMVGP